MNRFELTQKSVKKLLSSHVGLVGIWRGKRLKNVGQKNQHHYRKDGRLYVVYRNKRGELEHILSEVYYKTINNSCSPLHYRISKNTNVQEQFELDRDFKTYQYYKDKI